MSVYKKLPSCDGDCFNCNRPVEKCSGGQKQNRKSPYVKGTKPIQGNKPRGDFGAVHFLNSKIFRRTKI